MLAGVVVGRIVVIAVARVVVMGFVDMGFSFVDKGVSCAVLAGRSPLKRVLWRQEGIADGVVPTEEVAKHHGRRSVQLLSSLRLRRCYYWRHVEGYCTLLFI
jgi:hypothetical protein